MMRIELAMPIGLGVVLGVSAGAITGVMAGAVGTLIGFCAGAAVGSIAGAAIYEDERRSSARSRELDAIIGVASGDLGAAPVTIPPAPSESTSGVEGHERWLAEWLTPPPPVVT
jgi:hypothetical protein